MKQVGIFTLLVGIFLVGAVSPAFGDGLSSVEVPEANVGLSLPDGWAVVLRTGVVAHPELLEDEGASLDDVWQGMGEEHRYVQMFAPDWATQLAVEVHDPVAGDARVWNLDEADDAELRREGADIASGEALPDYGCRYEGVYVIGDLKYLVLSGESDAGDASFLQYYTIVNSRMTTVSIYTSLAKVTVQQRAVLKQVVDSTRFCRLRRIRIRRLIGSFLRRWIRL